MADALKLKQADGSSPRVRGTRAGQPIAQLHRRFIPACAGNTARRGRQRACPAVHPRVCGEHLRSTQQAPSGGGSSPRVRGTLLCLRRPWLCCRFIPACAGNTWPAGTSPGKRAVHPRVCGEHIATHQRISEIGGSSPRVRGTHGRRSLPPMCWRFIPACAGNTMDSATRSTLIRGSSPRVRGTLAPPKRRFVRRRFIPACAGNTWFGTRNSPGRTVHPRVCGEHFFNFRRTKCPTGSSPRVRGTPFGG